MQQKNVKRNGELPFAFACNPVFRPLPRHWVRNLNGRMLKRVAGHAQKGTSDFAVQSNFRCTNKVDDDACAVGRVFHFKLDADVDWAVTEFSAFQ